MRIPVLVERVKGNGYRARGTEPFALSARGATREEALAKLRAKIRTRLQNGSEVVGLEVGPEPHPWMEFAGMFKDRGSTTGCSRWPSIASRSRTIPIDNRERP
jgi:hypothetical protein